MADNAFFRSSRGAASHRLNLIAVEMAMQYHVDPEVMLNKPISMLMWLQELTIEMVRLQEEERRRAREEL